MFITFQFKPLLENTLMMDKILTSEEKKRERAEMERKKKEEIAKQREVN